VAQLLVYLTGSSITFFVLLHRIPGGWSEVTQVAAAAGHKLQFLDFSWNPATKIYFLVRTHRRCLPHHGQPRHGPNYRPTAAGREKSTDSRRALLTSGVHRSLQFIVFLLIGVLLTCSHNTHH